LNGFVEGISCIVCI